jgi:signal transduction histidine kinase
MESSAWTTTFGNLGLVALLLLVFSELIWRAPRSSPLTASVLVGLAFGAGAVLAMADPLQPFPGVFLGTIFSRRLERDGTLRFSFVSDGGALSESAAAMVADGAAFTRRLHPEDRERYAEGLRHSAATLETFDILYRLADPDGRFRWLHSRSRPRRIADGAIVWDGTVLDVTDRQEAEERLREAQERDRLAQQRLLAMGQLTGGIAHEFNNLLQVSVGAAQSLGDRLAADPPAAREAEIILEASERAAELTQRLLAFSRQQMLRPESNRVASLLLQLKRPFEELAGSKLSCLVELPDNGLSLRADRAALTRALLALAENACQASAPGGRIVLSARAGTGMGGRLGQVAITVRDDGCGMTEEVRRHAVEPFFTTRPVGEGAGLGLSMVEGFARQSGGSLEIDSELGRGARVTLWLPTRDPLGLSATPLIREPADALAPLRSVG